MDKYIQLKNKLKELDCFAMIIPSNDPHFGEYVQPYYGIRAWYSGFTGSAGTLVVTANGDALWTDSRYFVQAEEQLVGAGIELMRLKISGTPTISEWIKSKGGSECKIAIDKSLFSLLEYNSFVEEFSKESIVLVDDFFSDIWPNRPVLCFNKITALSTEYSGESTKSKYSRVVKELGVGNMQFVYPICVCDEIAWLCNIRGSDIPYNPLVQSYAAITHYGIDLFVDDSKLSEQVRLVLEENGVIIHNYFKYHQFLASVPSDWIRCLPSKITVKDYSALNVSGAKFTKERISSGVVNYLKSIKNDVELKGFNKAFEIDGVAWCNILEFIDKSLRNGVELSEYDIAEKLIEFRGESSLYKGESFSPIVAFGAAAALPHYSFTKEGANIIENNNFLLMDTGGQYLCGTTDTTRTIPIGELTEEQRRAYTLVLKGMINLTCAKFPKGTRGSQLDILARGPLFNEGWMYFHGTCHGIGHYLCVHEGPQSVRMEENPVTLEKGMVMSNEPAIYFEGKYGIRIENVIQVEEFVSSDFGDFYGFSTFTLVPISTKPVLKELLSADEIAWINWYNKRVYECLCDKLSDQVALWLKDYSTEIV